MCGVQAEIEPCLSGLIVAWNVVRWVTGKVGNIESLLWEAIDSGQKFPAEIDGFFLQRVKDNGVEGSNGEYRP